MTDTTTDETRAQLAEHLRLHPDAALTVYQGAPEQPPETADSGPEVTA